MEYTILVADDEKEIRDLLRLYLENEKYNVIEAKDGQQALDMLRSNKVDLCLLDIMMPNIDGYHVLQELRKESNMPARVNSNIRRFYKLGATDSVKVKETLKVRELELDTDACVLKKNGKVVELTSVEYRIMELLMSHPGKVYTKQQIYEAGWEDDFVVADNNIMVCISKLRSKLSEDQTEYIKTIRGLGYRMEK